MKKIIGVVIGATMIVASLPATAGNCSWDVVADFGLKVGACYAGNSNACADARRIARYCDNVKIPDDMPG